MKFPKKNCIITAGALLLLGIILLFTASRLPSKLLNQKQAERWAGDSEISYRQLSSFLLPGQTLEQESILAFRSKVAEELDKSTLELPENTAGFCDAWSQQGILKVGGPKGTFEVGAVAVGGDFFAFHPLQLRSGGFLYESDVMKDRVVLDEQTAWMLYGSTDLAGLNVTIGGADFLIAGVVCPEEDSATRAVREEQPVLYLPYERRDLLSSAGNPCYEIVLPEPVEGFARTVLEDHFQPADEITENTDRFSFASSLKQMKNFGMVAVRTQAVSFPYWENAARYTETWCTVLRALALLSFLFPLVIACILLVRLLKAGKQKLKSGGRKLREKVLDRSDERRRRRIERTAKGGEQNG